jgi:alkanesulfonate monooxygenase SsuD/methylene tetrahydromethanopterin reductase-like flavin-dependent oxidoreductase (luciferase family)
MLATVADTDTGLIAPDRVVAAARRAEATGFDGVYLGDHLLHPHPMLESIVTLSVVAAVTERISLGPCVMLFGLRHPVVLAKQLGTLAAFASGRLRVGARLRPGPVRRGNYAAPDAGFTSRAKPSMSTPSRRGLSVYTRPRQILPSLIWRTFMCGTIVPSDISVSASR